MPGALKASQDEQAVEPLLFRLSDPQEDFELRINAAWSLGMIESKKAIKPLIALLKVKSQQAIHAGVVESVGLLYSVEAVNPLIVKLSDKTVDNSIRGRCAYSLTMIGDSRALEPLPAALHDECEEVRYKAVTGLGQLGDKQAVPILERWVVQEKGQRPDWENKAGLISEAAFEELVVGGLKKI